MKIYDVTKIYGVYDTQPAAGRAAKKAAPNAGTDKLMLSKDAKDFQAVMKGLKEAPEVRRDKIAELEAKYVTGEHLANTKNIAEALIKSGVLNKTQN